MQSKINGPMNLVLHWNPVPVSLPLLSCTKQKHIFLYPKNMVVIYKHCSTPPLETASKEVSLVFVKRFSISVMVFFLVVLEEWYTRGLVW